MCLTISSKEIESIVKNVVLGSGCCKLTKISQTSQATQISKHELDYLDTWLNALTKKIWAFNSQVNDQKNTAMEFLNKYPEYGKGILPLINALQTNINTTVNNFVEKVNAYDPQVAKAPESKKEEQPAGKATAGPSKEQLSKVGEDFIKSPEGLAWIKYIEKNCKTTDEFSKYRTALMNAIKANYQKPTYQSKLNALLKWVVNKINASYVTTKSPEKSPGDLIGGLSKGISKEVADATKNTYKTPTTKLTPSRGGNPKNKGQFSKRTQVPVAQPVAQPSAAQRASNMTASNDYLNNKLGIVLSKN